MFNGCVPLKCDWNATSYLVFRIILEGTGPMILSIMAKCSLLSCVCSRRATRQSVNSSGRRYIKKIKINHSSSSTWHLKQGEAEVVLEQDAADAPHVTGMAPTQF